MDAEGVADPGLWTWKPIVSRSPPASWRWCSPTRTASPKSGTGDVAGAKIELSTDAVVRTASADYQPGSGLYGTVEGDLLWTFDKAASGHPLQTYMRARLRRV